MVSSTAAARPQTNLRIPRTYLSGQRDRSRPASSLTKTTEHHEVSVKAEGLMPASVANVFVKPSLGRRGRDGERPPQAPAPVRTVRVLAGLQPNRPRHPRLALDARLPVHARADEVEVLLLRRVGDGQPVRVLDDRPDARARGRVERDRPR